MQNIIALANEFITRLNSSTSLDNIKQELEKKYKDKEKINLENQIISIELTLFSFQILNPNLLKDFDNFTNLAINQAHDELINIYKWKSEPSINDLCITLSQINEAINESIKPILSIIRKDKITLETYESLKHLHSLKFATYSAKNLFLNAYTSDITPSFLNEFKTKIDDLGQSLTPSINPKQFLITSQDFLTNRNNVEVLQTNFNYLNQSLGGGFRTKCLYTLCGESGKGKTTLAIQLISDFAKQGVKSVFISLEMDKAELICRIIANLTGITYLRLDKYQRNELSFSNGEITKINNVDEYIKNILVLENSELAELTQLKNAIKCLATNGYKFFVIDTKDHLVNSQGKGESYEMHTQIAKSLKDLVKEQDISILLLSQANRSIQNLKKDELPNRTHISQSLGTYAQSDGVSFIYTKPESKALVLYTDKSRYAPKSDEFQMIEIDNECLRVREINTIHAIDEVG